MILCFSHDRSSQVLSGVALLSYRAANVPKDKEHPYGSRATLILLFHSYPLYYIHTYIHTFLLSAGHGKFETLGALGISAMLLATGCGIAWHAVHLLFVCTLFYTHHSLISSFPLFLLSTTY